MKKSYSSAFKAQVVLELLKETKTLTQLAREHDVHPNVLRAWRDQALTDFATLFDRRDSFADAEAAHQKQQEELYAEIGRLTTQVNFLQKRLPA
jgi:putative transposase